MASICESLLIQKVGMRGLLTLNISLPLLSPMRLVKSTYCENIVLSFEVILFSIEIEGNCWECRDLLAVNHVL